MFKHLVIAFLFFCVISDTTTTIEWSDTLALNWSHFKGQPDNTNDAVAVTASGITFGYALGENNGVYNKFEATVIAHFYPEESWYKPTRVNDTVLAHERLHFDITEWHARELRKEIAKLQISQNIKEQLESLYQKASLKLRATQKKYDRETDHSMIVPEQLRWQKLVAIELEKLEEFQGK